MDFNTCKPLKKWQKTLNFETFFKTNLNLDSHLQVGFTGIWLFWNPLSFDGLSHISRKLNFEALFRVCAPASKFHRFIKLVGDQSQSILSEILQTVIYIFFHIRFLSVFSKTLRVMSKKVKSEENTTFLKRYLITFVSLVSHVKGMDQYWSIFLFLLYVM